MGVGDPASVLCMGRAKHSGSGWGGLSVLIVLALAVTLSACDAPAGQAELDASAAEAEQTLRGLGQALGLDRLAEQAAELDVYTCDSPFTTARVVALRTGHADSAASLNEIAVGWLTAEGFDIAVTGGDPSWRLRAARDGIRVDVVIERGTILFEATTPCFRTE